MKYVQFCIIKNVNRLALSNTIWIILKSVNKYKKRRKYIFKRR